MDREPFDDVAARKKAKEIVLGGGTVSYSTHAREEMAADDLDEADVRNVIRGGWVEFSEKREHRGLHSWRYRCTTGTITVVVAFRSESEIRVVTAWREKKVRR